MGKFVISAETKQKWEKVKKAELDANQLEAVNVRDANQVCVIAGAGSGKTRLLIYRFLDLLIKDELKLWQIAAITYTNAAADELKDRIMQKLLELNEFELLREIEGAYISTIHSFALKLITEYTLYSNHDLSFMDLSPVERSYLLIERQNELSRKIQRLPNSKLKEIFRKYEFKNISNTVFNLIKLCNENGILPNKLKSLTQQDRSVIKTIIAKKFKNYSEENAYNFEIQEQEFQDYLRTPLIDLTIAEWEFYQDKKIELKRLEFIDYLKSLDDLLNEDNLAVKTQFKEILIDEFQDTNSFQFNLISKLKPCNGKIFTVGDARQSIYRFQHADITVFANYSSGAFSHDLSINYRSHPDIIKFCNELFYPAWLCSENVLNFNKLKSPINPNPNFFEPDEITRRPRLELLMLNNFINKVKETKGKKDKVVKYDSLPKDELIKLKCRFIANWIYNLVNNEKFLVRTSTSKTTPVKYSDIAILIRKRNRSFDIKKALEEKGIPSLVVNGNQLLKQPIVLDIISALKFLKNPCDDINLIGLLKSPLIGISEDAIYWLTQKQFELKLHLPKENCNYGDFSLYETLIRITKQSTVVDSSSVLPAKLLLSMSDVEILHFSKYISLLDDFCLNFLPLVYEIQNLTPLEVVDNIYKILHVNLRVAGYSDDRNAESNFYAFRELITELQLRNDSYFNEIVNTLEEYIDKGVIVDEAAPTTGLGEETRNAVKITTIHGTKGLEFPVVLVVDTESDFSIELNRTFMNQSISYNNLSADKDFGVVGRYFKLDKNDDTKLVKDREYYHLDKKVSDKQARILEMFRLYYVAFTRAKDLLFITGFSDFENSITNDNQVIKTAKRPDHESVLQYANNNLSHLDYKELFTLSTYSKSHVNFISYLQNFMQLTSSPFSEHQRFCDTNFKASETINFRGVNIKRWFYIPDIKHSISSFSHNIDSLDDFQATKIKTSYEFSNLKPSRDNKESIPISAKELAEFLHDPSKHIILFYKHLEDTLHQHVCFSDDINPIRSLIGSAGQDKIKVKTNSNQKVIAPQVGTIVHKILELLEFELASKNLPKALQTAKIKSCYYSLHPNIINSSTEIINNLSIFNKFFSSTIHAKKILKETQFRLNISNFEIVGVIDLLLFYDECIHIVEYKTDRKYDSKTLTNRYYQQMLIYALAVYNNFNQFNKNFTIKCFILPLRGKKPIEVKITEQNIQDALQEISTLSKTVFHKNK